MRLAFARGTLWRMNDTAITAAEAARLLNVSAVWVRRLLRRGLLSGRKHGRDWLVNYGACLAYRDRRLDGQPAEHAGLEGQVANGR